MEARKRKKTSPKKTKKKQPKKSLLQISREMGQQLIIVDPVVLD